MRGYSTKDVLDECFSEWRDHPILRKIESVLKGEQTNKVVQTKLGSSNDQKLTLEEPEEDDAIKAMGYTGAKCTECGASMMNKMVHVYFVMSVVQLLAVHNVNIN